MCSLQESVHKVETLEYAGFCADWMQIGRGVDAQQQPSTVSLLFCFFFFDCFVVGKSIIVSKDQNCKLRALYLFTVAKMF
jgi:hypothetical protein